MFAALKTGSRRSAHGCSGYNMLLLLLQAFTQRGDGRDSHLQKLLSQNPMVLLKVEP